MIQRYRIALLLLFLLPLISPGKDKPAKNKPFSNPKSDVFMQGFYWNSTPGGIWWDSLAALAPSLASAGFSAIWVPPPNKGASGSSSMGYDIYDNYDFGEFNQQYSVATRFGTRPQLVNAISSFHNVGMGVFCDIVLNDNDGGEADVPYTCKPYSTYPDSGWMVFNYPYGSGRFKKNASMFYPNTAHCDVNSPYHGPDNIAYQFGYWLDKDQDSIRDSLIVWGQYMKQTMKFDGYRIDQGKALDPAFLGPWLSAVNGGTYAVAEYFGGLEMIGWLNSVISNGGTNNFSNFALFDFPLRYTLHDMCNNTDGTWDMHQLDGAGLVANGVSGFNVSTFVENHDVDRVGWDGVDAGGGTPIIYNKVLAYAFVMFSEGRPCVFFKDYYMYGLKNQIDTLIWIRQHYLGGGTTGRNGLNPYYVRSDGNTDQTGNHVYIAKRNGYGDQPGGYLVINNDATYGWSVWVDTDLPQGTMFKDFSGHNPNATVLGPAGSDPHNRVELGAWNRNFSIYVADTTASFNFPPVIQTIPQLSVYTGDSLSYKSISSDEDGDSLSFAVSGPVWLSVSVTGMLSGKPALSDSGLTTFVLTVNDNHSGTATDSFTVNVVVNHAPTALHIADTTIQTTKRFQHQIAATDLDGDALTFTLTQAPAWLNLGSATGILSGTPDVADVGSDTVKFSIADGKGGSYSASFRIIVIPTQDSIISTYSKPTIDGTPTISGNDWQSSWRIADTTSKSHWWTNVSTPNNQFYALYTTWDADSLYLGVDYLLNDPNNAMMLYVGAGQPNGITNFKDSSGYKGGYPKNIVIGSGVGVNFFAAAYDLNKPSMFVTAPGDSAVNIDSKIHSARGSNGHGAEIAVAWNDLFGLGAGLVPNHLQMKIVGVIVGGTDYGGGNSIPDNPSVNGTPGPDTLVNFVTVAVDSNGDGIPDPTVVYSASHQPRQRSIAVAIGWNMISLPIALNDYRTSIIFSGAASSTYKYDPVNGYSAQDTLKNGIGYFIKYAAVHSFSLSGYDRLRDTVNVKAGWNLIGVIDTAIQTSTVISIPAAIIESPFYYYDKAYKQTATVGPGKGYWIKVTQDGKLILSE
ncbi:MAG TPA: putative Ig domain-containing protein [Bacteroidota bacterium]|nr:putative Ig domain-containing protein [Bacteroidota bacterium]